MFISTRVRHSPFHLTTEMGLRDALPRAVPRRWLLSISKEGASQLVPLFWCYY